MDLATLVGLVGTLVVLATAIVLGGSVGAFADTASFVLVIGGTLLVTLMKFSFPQFLNATKVAFKAFIYRVPEPEALIDTSISLANQAPARKGFLPLRQRGSGGRLERHARSRRRVGRRDDGRDHRFATAFCGAVG